MKSLKEIQADMAALYNELRDGERDLKTASEMANIAGKDLKAKSLELAREIFASGLAQKGNALTIEHSVSGD